jgi:hypothetical protein
MADHRPVPEPNLLHFGMRQLLAFVAGTAVLCGAIAASGTGWRIVIASLAALVAAHVAGTYLGTRLRDTSSEVYQWKSLQSPLSPDEPIATPPPVHWDELGLPAGSPLAICEETPRRSLGALAGGGVLGACLGAGGIGWTLGDEVSWPGYIVGAISCGVIGAWAALLAASFITIGRRAWKQASAETRRR